MSDSQDRIEKSIELNAPLERVWRALTDHEEFGTWFRVRLDGPFEMGTPSTGTMTYPGYEHVKWRAEVVAMEPQKLFAFTWHPDAEDPDAEPDKTRTRVEFHLSPRPGGCTLTVIESGFLALADSERRLNALRQNTQGWEEQMRNIAAHVAG